MNVTIFCIYFQTSKLRFDITLHYIVEGYSTLEQKYTGQDLHLYLVCIPARVFSRFGMFHRLRFPILSNETQTSNNEVRL